MSRRAALTDIEVLTVRRRVVRERREESSVEVTWYMISRPGVA